MATQPTSLPGHFKEAARRKMQRNLASAILFNMADVGVDFPTLDKVIGKPSGFTRRLVARLADGKVKDLYMISDLALALHKEALIGFVPTRPEGSYVLA